MKLFFAALLSVAFVSAAAASPRSVMVSPTMPDPYPLDQGADCNKAQFPEAPRCTGQ